MLSVQRTVLRSGHQKGAPGRQESAPDLPRGFRVPFYPWVPITSIIFSLLVVIGLPTITFVIFGLWVAAWLAFYFLYGIKHSRLGRLPDEGAQPRQPSFRR